MDQASRASKNASPPPPSTTVTTAPAPAASTDAQLARLQTLFESMPDGVAVVDVSEDVVEMNPAALRLLGYAQAGDAHRSLTEFARTFEMRTTSAAPGSGGPRLLSVDEWPAARALRGETIRDVEVELRRTDTGTSRLVSFSAVPVRDAGGQVVQAIVILRDLTPPERLLVAERDARAAAQAAESRYRELVDSIDAIVWEYDWLARRFTFVNRAAEQVLGFPLSRWYGDPEFWPNFIHPDDREPSVALCLRQTRAGCDHELEYRAVAADGRVVWLRDIVYLVRGDAGTVIGLRGLMMDVTDRKRAEAALRESEEQYRAFFSLAAVGASQADPQTGRFIRVNDAFCDITGYSADELCGMTFVQLTHPDHREADVARYRRMVSGEAEGYVTEKRYIRKDGREVWVRVNASLVRDAGGAPAFTIAVISDIDASKRALDALAASEERFEAFLDNSATASWITDPADGATVYASRPYQRMFGFPEGRVVGRTMFDLFPPDVARAFQEENRAVLARRGPIEVTNEVRRPDGTVGHFLVHKFPLRDASGRVLVGATALDITDRARAESELQAAKEAAEASNRAKDQFLAVLSHELRTPLTPVLLTASSLQLDPTLSDDVRELVKMMREQVELEARLIDDLLDLTRIQRGKLVAHFKQVDAQDVLRRVIELSAGRAEEEGLTLDVKVDATVARLRADPARLQQLFANVLGNAIKFTAAGGRVTVRTWNDEGERTGYQSGQRDDGRLIIEIEDTGIGMSEETLASIFTPFEQGERTITRRFGGLGLGLTIARAVAEMHGGTLTAASAGAGRGATFTISLPLPATAAPAPPAPAGLSTSADRHVAGVSAPSASSTPSAPAPPAPPRAPMHRGRVLIVEDHIPTLVMLTRLLGRVGYDVVAADNFADALRHATSAPRPDLLLSDIGLPDRSGWELLEEIRRADAAAGRPPLKAVALSGYGTDDDIDHSTESGFLAHVVKPVDLERLEALVGELVGNSSRSGLHT